MVQFEEIVGCFGKLRWEKNVRKSALGDTHQDETLVLS